MENVEKLLYSKREAAFALGLSVRTIESIIAKKRLGFRRYGRKVLIPAADVRRFASANDYTGRRGEGYTVGPGGKPCAVSSNGQLAQKSGGSTTTPTASATAKK